MSSMANAGTSGKECESVLDVQEESTAKRAGRRRNRRCVLVGTDVSEFAAGSMRAMKIRTRAGGYWRGQQRQGWAAVSTFVVLSARASSAPGFWLGSMPKQWLHFESSRRSRHRNGEREGSDTQIGRSAREIDA